MKEKGLIRLVKHQVAEIIREDVDTTRLLNVEFVVDGRVFSVSIDKSHVDGLPWLYVSCDGRMSVFPVSGNAIGIRTRG